MFASTLKIRPLALSAAVMLAAAGTLAAQARTPDAQKRPAARPAQHEASEQAERTLSATRVPAAVREAFRRAYPNARVLKYGSEEDSGRTRYEVESREGAIHRDVSFAADGTLLETETQVTLAQLPAAVRTAATANGAHVDLAEVVVMGRDTIYEFKIRGRAEELKLLPNGQLSPARP